MSVEEAQLAQQYDVALFDLDGVIYAGDDAIPFAAESLSAAKAAGMRAAFVTNNASRTPDQVRDKLASFGVQAEVDEIITSAQVAADVLRTHLEPGARVLVVGDVGLREAVTGVGLVVTDLAADNPVAVVQGFSREIGWRALSEATVAIRAGALWVASNLDSTIPSARGILPGNGAMVDVVATALGRRPGFVAGKPDRTMHTASVSRMKARRPLVIGDRLDTDIEGASRSNCDSLLVMTGVTSPAAAVAATAAHRPTFIGSDLRDLLKPGRQARQVTIDSGEGWVLGQWEADADGRIRRTKDETTKTDTDEGLMDYLRVACAITWSGGVAKPGDDWSSRVGAQLEIS